MSSIAISLIVFEVVFAGALLDMFLRKLLPQNHLSDESKAIVRIVMGMVAAMTALVLGLLISCAKSSSDGFSGEVTTSSSKIIAVDHTLANYGPETKEARDLIRTIVTNIVDQMALQNRRMPCI
jgi:hypothetical protein